MNKIISIVIPAFNEDECLPELVSRLRGVFEVEKEYDFEVVLIDNGSTDRSWDLICEVSANDNRFHGVQLSRNFGADGAISAGLEFIRGDACVIMMADLEEPPHLISEFLRKWEEGFENVYGEVRSRPGAPVGRRIASSTFYRFASRMTGQVVVENASDFRLVDRRVYEAVRDLPERNQFLRGLFSWVGFSSTGVPFDRDKRFAGNSKAYTPVVLSLAIRGILSHSVAPIRAIFLFGIVLATMAGLTLVALTARFFIYGVPFDGFGTLVALTLVGFAFVFMFLGVIGEYLALIFEEVQGRPDFIIRNLTDISGSKHS